jgi:hypothetical protein
MQKPRKKQGKVASAKSEIVANLPAACASEASAVEFMERVRWAGSPTCPRCSSTNVYPMTARTVRTGTVFEDSRIPLTAWAYAFWAACAGKKGVSAKQIERQTGLSYKSALFLMHRIRFAMTPDLPAPKLTGVVEADETFIGGKPRNRIHRATRFRWSRSCRAAGICGPW